MDDWVVIAPTRWKLRRAVRGVNQTLNRLLVEKHPDKTFIGRAEKGIGFLGYFMTPTQIRASDKSMIRCLNRLELLNAQGADKQRMDDYIRHWLAWYRAI